MKLFISVDARAKVYVKSIPLIHITGPSINFSCGPIVSKPAMKY